MRLLLAPVLAALVALPCSAAELAIRVAIPRLEVAEYHRPYVALWLERPGAEFVANLAVWYDLSLKDKEGTKWLKDLRQWWRRSGRTLEMPVDGISGATRPPGAQALRFDTLGLPLADLEPGDYELVVEAAREVGGRELLRVPFTWPPASALSLERKGAHELVGVVLDITP